jgi:4'-phosphopantetheinyl transferase
MKVVDGEVAHGFDAEISQNSKKLLFDFLKPSAVNKKLLSTQNPHVWCASFSEHKKNIDKFEPLLSLEENFRANSFIHRHDRQRAVLARGLLRTLLAKYLDSMPVDLEFMCDQFGKPILSAEKYKTAPIFNLSHSGDFFLLVVAAPDSKIGIDIEQHRSISELLKIADKYFHSKEVEELSSLPLPVQAVAFFDCWTRKESIVKALGLGISTPLLGDFRVSILPNIQPKLLSWLGSEDEVNLWAMRKLQLPENGYSATVATRGISLQQVHFWYYTNQ